VVARRTTAIYDNVSIAGVTAPLFATSFVMKFWNPKHENQDKVVVVALVPSKLLATMPVVFVINKIGTLPVELLS